MRIRSNTRLEIGRLFASLEYGEQMAHDCAMSQVRFFDDRCRGFFARQARQEKHHAQVFRRVILCATPFAAAAVPPGLKRFRSDLEAACNRRDQVESLVGQQVVLEGFGELVLFRMDRKFDQRGVGFRRVRKILLHQEQGHLAFGERVLRGLLESGAARLDRIQDTAARYLYQVDQILDELQPVFEVVDADCDGYKKELRQRLPQWVVPK